MYHELRKRGTCVVLDLKSLRRACRNNGRAFKSTTLGATLIPARSRTVTTYAPREKHERRGAARLGRKRQSSVTVKWSSASGSPGDSVAKWTARAASVPSGSYSRAPVASL